MFRGLIYRVVGPPPSAEAGRGLRLLWTRKFYRLHLMAIALAVVLAVVIGGSFLWILAAVGAVWWAIGLASISVSIHGERSRGGPAP